MSTPSPKDALRAKDRARKRAAFLRETIRWHWISAAICLVGTLLFAATGLTLNHAAALQAEPRVVERTAHLPSALLQQVRDAEAEEGALPAAARTWLADAFKLRLDDRPAIEWSPGEAYLPLPGPGRDGRVQIDTATGDVLYERTHHGAVAVLNDLHKGRNTGPAWRWFIDLFAVGCVVFCITGFIILQLNARARPSTWPLVGLGVAIPLIIALLFIH